MCQMVQSQRVGESQGNHSRRFNAVERSVARSVMFVRRCGADDVIAYDRTPLNGILRAHPEWEVVLT
jgi:hypothetical protein